jgi:exportin-2 (importin alpha re-exporter)
MLNGYHAKTRTDADGLPQKLVSSLTPTNYAINLGVLQTAHSIFVYWRAATRSDELFTVINLVLGSFGKPLLQLLQHTSNLLLNDAPSDDTSTPELRAQAQVLLVELYYDLTCQDLPPDFEDTHAGFFGPNGGLFLKFLTWDPPQLRGDVSSYCL